MTVFWFFVGNLIGYVASRFFVDFSSRSYVQGIEDGMDYESGDCTMDVHIRVRDRLRREWLN